MKKISCISIAAILFALCCSKKTINKPVIEGPKGEPVASSIIIPFGVNLASAEFGSTFPGTYGQDYTYPTMQELDYFRSKGLKLIRLPFKWERIQPVLGAPLDNIELNRIISFVDSADKKGLLIILDMHNYGRRSINGTTHIIGSPAVLVDHVKNAWEHIANAFKNKRNIWGYGIMNEPHNMLSTPNWVTIAQEIIVGIRAKDTTTPIIVGGDNWSSAERWLSSSNNLKDLIDPYNKIIFEAHVYFDKDASGVYKDSYDAEQATPNIGVQRVTPFINWLKINRLKGFIGEYGVPNDDSRWLIALDNFLSYLRNNCVNGTYWAAGPWWGNNKLSVEPQSGGIDKPQMFVLQKYKELDSSLCK